MRFLLSLFAASTILAGSAFGWGCEGHPMVALIARAHLTPAVSAAVDRLLKEFPADPNYNPYCKDLPSDPMAKVASWADDMKKVDKKSTWHFVDIPLAVHRSDVGGPDLTKWCEAIGPSVDGKDRPGCLTNAIGYEWERLRDKSLPALERATALRYLIHFVGDLSQPLHNEDNHDQGGNCTRIALFGAERLENLHSIWDDRLIDRDVRAHQSSLERYAAGVDQEFAKNWSKWGEGRTDVVAWAWEGHEIAAETAYGKLKPRIPVAPANAGQTDRDGCNAGRAATEAMHIAIGDEYMGEVLPVIRQQLAKGGYRLAAMLNQGF